MKKILKALLIATLALTLALSLASCGSGSTADGTGSSNGGNYSGGAYGEDAGGTTGSNDSLDIPTENRKIIKTVNQSMQTEDFDGVVDHINTLVAELGGYITDSNFRGESYYNEDSLRSGTLTIRIPAEKLSDFVKRSEEGGVVTRYNESANDVTNAYIDVESRIAVYEAEEAALLEMLEASPDIETMLAIRKSLNEVQYNLASLRAQKNSYDSRIEYSTVYLTVEEVRQVTLKNPTFFEEVGDNFSGSLYGLGRFFRNLAVWFIGDILYILLWAAVIAVVIFLISRHKKKKNRNIKVRIIEGSSNNQNDNK